MMAAATFQLAWKGRTYQLERPELVSGPEVLRACSVGQRITLHIAGFHDFVWLHEKTDAGSALPDVSPVAGSGHPSDRIEPLRR